MEKKSLEMILAFKKHCLLLKRFTKVKCVQKMILKRYMHWGGAKKMFLMPLSMQELFLEMVEF